MNITIKEVPNSEMLVFELSKPIPNEYGGVLAPFWNEDSLDENFVVHKGLKVLFKIWKEIYSLPNVVGARVNFFEITMKMSSSYLWRNIETDILNIIVTNAVKDSSVYIKAREKMIPLRKKEIEQEIQKTGKKLIWL